MVLENRVLGREVTWETVLDGEKLQRLPVVLACTNYIRNSPVSKSSKRPFNGIFRDEI